MAEPGASADGGDTLSLPKFPEAARPRHVLRGEGRLACPPLKRRHNDCENALCIVFPLNSHSVAQEEKYAEMYRECVVIMRTMFHKCRLVHADLSEYNILYFKGHLWIIDVSQSVEHDHPNSLQFLRKDCENIKDFFSKNKILTMNTRELFDFVTDPTLKDEDVDAYLEKIQSAILSRGTMTPEEEIDDAVFKQVHIPRTLNEVVHFERDAVKAGAGGGEELFYLTLTGLKDDVSGARETPTILEGENSDGHNKKSSDLATKEGKDEKDEKESDSEEGEDEDEDEDEEEGEEEEGEEGVDPASLSKKERKKLVKEENREKRKNKVPKHIKKRKKTLAKRKGK